VRGEVAWLADLARLLADDSVTVAITGVELLGESARCAA
jgi:hypothetical protein